MTGSDLRRRIESILCGGVGRPLSGGRRWALALVAAIAVGLPLVAGAVSAVPLVTIGQEPSTPVRFAVASIKANKSGEQGSLTSGSPGVFTGTNVYVAHLIRRAYDIEENQIEAAPDWILRTSRERFDITARLESVPTDDERDRVVAAALRSLLAERFNLVVKRATREVPVYALVMARRDGQPGPQLKRASFDCSTPEGRKLRADRIAAGGPPGTCGINSTVGRIRLGSRSMADLARGLTGIHGLDPDIGRVVIDRTGLTGLWEFELTYMPNQPVPPQSGGEPAAIDPNTPSLPTALQEQLGLKLEPTRGTIEVLVVERVERPTEN